MKPFSPRLARIAAALLLAICVSAADAQSPPALTFRKPRPVVSQAALAQPVTIPRAQAPTPAPPDPSPPLTVEPLRQNATPMLSPPASPEQVMSPPMEGGAYGDDCVGCTSVVGPGGGPSGPWQTGPSRHHWLVDQLNLRHSSTHGRAMGPGGPLRGTSWRNRPYWLSLDVGALLMADRVAPNVRAANDTLGAIGLGWDWDHYWGTQIRVGWSTPELLNTTQTALGGDDNLFITDLSLLYYPWGDSRLRPYYRVGVGLTDVEFVNDNGIAVQESLLTLPFGVGMKYQFRRGMAWRVELMDNLAIGQNETATLNNLTITTGLEWRFGGRPSGYWAWAGRGGAW